MPPGAATAPALGSAGGRDRRTGGKGGDGRRLSSFPGFQELAASATDGSLWPSAQAPGSRLTSQSVTHRAPNARRRAHATTPTYPCPAAPAKCPSGSSLLALTSPSEKLVWMSFTLGSLNSVPMDQRE